MNNGFILPFNKQSVGYPTTAIPQQYTQQYPYPVNVATPTPTIYKTPQQPTPLQQHSIQQQHPYYTQPIQQQQPYQTPYQPVVVQPVYQQPPQQPFDNANDRKFENKLNEMKINNERLNEKVDKMLVLMNNNNISNQPQPTQLQTQQRTQHLTQHQNQHNKQQETYNNMEYHDEYDILDIKKVKNKKNIMNISIDTHEKILWSAINYQTGSIYRLASNTLIDADIIRNSLGKYWLRRKMMTKHGRNGNKLIMELKKENINLNNIFIRKLRLKYGEFEFESLAMDDEMDIDERTECAFFDDAISTPTELSTHIIHLHCFVFLFSVYLFVHMQ